MIRVSRDWISWTTSVICACVALVTSVTSVECGSIRASFFSFLSSCTSGASFLRAWVSREPDLALVNCDYFGREARLIEPFGVNDRCLHLSVRSSRHWRCIRCIYVSYYSLTSNWQCVQRLSIDEIIKRS